MFQKVSAGLPFNWLRFSLKIGLKIKKIKEQDFQKLDVLNIY